MARKYVPKKSARWPNKDKRMARAVELRALGWSLRKIAARLVVSEGTVRNDLQRWDRERPNVTPLRNSGAQKCPAGGEITHPDYAPGADIVPLRRSS